MDVKTAFFNGDLHEDKYIQQPEGFVAKGNEEMVCNLKRSFCTNFREWYHKFDTFSQSKVFTEVKWNAARPRGQQMAA